MPFGWDRGDTGRTARDVAQQRNDPIRVSWFDQVTTIAQDAAQAVVEIVHRVFVPTIWTRWTTAFDEKVCPICGPYAGRVWPEGEGPEPPLHPNCRCHRSFAFTTWAVRE